MGLGGGLGTVRCVALRRLGSGRTVGPVSELEGTMVTLALTLADMPPNLSLNADASPAALRAVRSAPVSLVR